MAQEISNLVSIGIAVLKAVIIKEILNAHKSTVTFSYKPEHFT